MTMASHDNNSKRGYLGRCVVLAIGGGALGCSILTPLSCDFIGVEDVVVTDNAFSEAPYLKTVGLFYFSSAANDICERYGAKLFQSNFNEWFTTGQVASLAAPAFGLIGWILVLSEVLISQCRFNGSFVLQNALFIAAFTLQCCTFLLLGQTQFCFYDKKWHCTWEIGSILSVAAASMFYACSILLCCLSRPNTFQNHHDEREHEDDKV